METSNYAVLVLEQPLWPLPDEDPAQNSVRPFVDVLSRHEDLPVFFATFVDSSSFGQALKNLLDTDKLDDVEHLIVYVAANHGAASCFGGSKNVCTMNVKTVFDRIKSLGKGKVIGLILDSFEMGVQADTIEIGMESAKIRWVIGYAGCTEWLTTTLINLRALSVVTCLDSDDFKDEDMLMGVMQLVFEMFNPYLEIDDDTRESDDDDLDDSLTLADVLSVTIRSGRCHPKTLMPEEIWPDLADDDDDDDE